MCKAGLLVTSYTTVYLSDIPRFLPASRSFQCKSPCIAPTHELFLAFWPPCVIFRRLSAYALTNCSLASCEFQYDRLQHLTAAISTVGSRNSANIPTGTSIDKYQANKEDLM